MFSSLSKLTAYKVIAPLFVFTIFGLPLAALGLPYALYPGWWVFVVTLFVAPVVYSLLFVLTAGLLSRPFQKGVVPGKFPRELTNPVYRARRLYGLCWTCVYYFKPLYFICLTVPELKWLMFRLFGYRGQMNFTVYPDTWIRDLPLLNFGAGAYIANRATLGTNMALSNGTILVDGIHVGRGATVGHLAMLAPGVTLGDEAEVGAGCEIGIRVALGKAALVQPGAIINHMTSLGERVTVGTMSYVGAGTKISDKIAIATGAIVPNRTTIQFQAQADALISSQVSELAALLQRLRGVESKNERQDNDFIFFSGQCELHHEFEQPGSIRDSTVTKDKGSLVGSALTGARP